MRRPSHPDAEAAVLPNWNATERVLRFAGEIVKQFRVPAANQEAVLYAFQASGWRSCIANPLVDGDEITAQRRLHDAIARLNKCQPIARLRFSGNGLGNGICWEAISD